MRVDRIGHNVLVTGKSAGSRRAAKQSRVNLSAALGYAIGITLLIVAWGYLVYVAIDFGSSARSGQSAGWWLLGLASLGAVACLFIGLLLITRLLRLLEQRPKTDDGHPAPPRIPGGRRAAR